MKLTIDLSVKTISGILIGAIAALAFAHGIGNAQSSSSGLTGKCAGVATVNRKFQTVANQKGTDFIYLFNFDTRTVYSQVNLTDTVTEPNKVKYSTQQMTTEAFTLTDGDIPGSYVITTPNGDKTIAIPVNSGNAFVFQFVDDNIIGMCQKV
jgi:lipoprotein-anchoring transpeptidase ErfK/SrfK